MSPQGDFTRTGERKLAGVMKDGVNSANRYYLNRFKDAYRQAVIGKSCAQNFVRLIRYACVMYSLHVTSECHMTCVVLAVSLAMV